MPWIRSVAGWLLIILAETAHGTLRTVYLAPVIGDAPARRLGVLSGTLIIFVIALALTRWLDARTAAAQLGVGALWVMLTVTFEVGVGRWVLGYDWLRILGDYDLARGGLLGLGLVAMFFMPWLAARARPPR